MADTPTCRKAEGWRQQLSYLLQEYGRNVVIESLTDNVPGLTTRHATILADLAERTPSDLVPVVN